MLGGLGIGSECLPGVPSLPSVLPSSSLSSSAKVENLFIELIVAAFVRPSFSCGRFLELNLKVCCPPVIE